MRREGWQRGTVRCTVKTSTGPAADADAAAAEEEEDQVVWSNAKAPSVAKPTNHSRFTGKCKRARCATCHSLPVSKSRDKAKGTRKLRSCDVALNHRLVSWRVAAAGLVDDDDDAVGSAHWSKYSGFSASGILDQLSSERDCCRDEDDHDEDETGGALAAECSDAKEKEEEEEDDDEEEEFCQVGIVWEYIDGEDWCLVHEM